MHLPLRLPRTAVAAALLVLAALLPAAPARAEAPTFFKLEETYLAPVLSELCGSPVEVHVDVTLIERATQNGRAINLAGMAVSYTNLDTGATVTYRQFGLQTQTVKVADGLEVWSAVANGGSAWIVRGQPVLNAGRSTFMILRDEATGEIWFEDSLNGRHDGFFVTVEQLCEWLCE